MKIPEGNTKEEINRRKDIISRVYRHWTIINQDKKVYNPSLKGNICVKYLSITETMRHAAKTHQSTLAVLQLDRILREAQIVGKPKPPKKGVANQKAFKYLLETRCQLLNVGEIKMMVGVKKSGEMIQYCITAVGNK